MEAPATLSAGLHARLYAPVAARVARLEVDRSDRVAKGQPLLVLEAPDLEWRITKADQRIEALRWELDHATTNSPGLRKTLVHRAELAEALTERQGYERQRRQLRLTAPFPGVVTDVADGLARGRWVSRTTPLIELIDPEHPVVEAYLPEPDLRRIAASRKGVFVPESLEHATVPLRMTRVDPVASAELAKPHLASVHGGAIAVRLDGQGRRLPHEAIYRVVFEPIPAGGEYRQLLRGTVRIPAESTSFVNQAWTVIASTLIRESGF